MAGDVVTYALVNQGSSPFTIDSQTGVVRLKESLTPDYEEKSSYDITVKATVGEESATKNVTMNVTNVNEAPVRSPV